MYFYLVICVSETILVGPINNPFFSSLPDVHKEPIVKAFKAVDKKLATLHSLKSNR